jgi:hypothetical protein
MQQAQFIMPMLCWVLGRFCLQCTHVLLMHLGMAWLLCNKVQGMNFQISCWSVRSCTADESSTNQCEAATAATLWQRQAFVNTSLGPVVLSHAMQNSCSAAVCAIDKPNKVQAGKVP